MAFIGSDALRSGRLTRGQLRWNHTAVLPDVYVEKTSTQTLAASTRAAALWVPDGVVAGRSAAALHGAAFVAADTPIDIIGRSRRPQHGVVVRAERIGADEITRVDGLAVTTPARTALDLARHIRRAEAIAHLDALAAATGLDPVAVLSLARRYRGARGVRRARNLIPLLDAGAQSPRESWLRLLLIDGGFPRPATQIKVSDGHRVAFIDMGWEEPRIAVEYDGDQHRSDRTQFVKDIRRYEMLADLGWLVIRVVKEHSPTVILSRVGDAFRRRARSTPGS